MFILSKNLCEEAIELDTIPEDPVIPELDSSTKEELENFVNDNNKETFTVVQTEQDIKENIKEKRRKHLKKLFNEIINNLENLYTKEQLSDCEDDKDYDEEDEEDDDEEEDDDYDEEEEDDNYDEEEDDDYDDDDDSKYVISINGIPYFYFDSLDQSRKELHKIARKMLVNESKDYGGYLSRNTYDKNKLTVFRTMDFIIFKHHYPIYTLQIDVVNKP
jgi:hypothetical protein